MMLKLKRTDYQLSSSCICPAGVSQNNQAAVEAFSRSLVAAQFIAAGTLVVAVYQIGTWLASLDWYAIFQSAAIVIGFILFLIVLFFQVIIWIGKSIRGEFDPYPLRVVRFVRRLTRSTTHRVRVYLYRKQIARNADQQPEVKVATYEELMILNRHHDNPVVSEDAIKAYKEALSAYQASIKPKAQPAPERVSQAVSEPQNHPSHIQEPSQYFPPVNLN